MKVAALAVGALLLGGCGGQKEDVERSVVLVSGRDDHGLLVQRQVGLSASIGGEPESYVSDGTLVRVEATHGEWIQVRALERSDASGWVNDYYLRGTAFTPSGQVELVAVDGPRVLVRSLKTERLAWVPRRAVSELPTSG